MFFSYVSQVNIHASKTSPLGMVLAENECASRQQQQNRRNDKKQFFHRRYNTSILNKISITVGRNPGRAHLQHNREARASGLLWFAPLGCHTSAGWPLSRPSQCAHWLALRAMRQHRPALTADGQRSMFPARGAQPSKRFRIVTANHFIAQYDSYFLCVSVGILRVRCCRRSSAPCPESV